MTEEERQQRYGRRSTDKPGEYPASCKGCPNAPPRIRIFTTLTAKTTLAGVVITLVGLIGSGTYAALNGAFHAGDYYRTQAEVATKVEILATEVHSHDEILKRLEIGQAQVLCILRPNQCQQGR